MPDLDFIKVTGRFGLTVGDGPDPDENPDTIWCDEGQVRLVPLNTYTKVAGGAPKPWTAGHSVIDTAIDVNGYISWSGQPYVWMVDLTSDKVNPKVSPGKATHRVEFRNVRAGGVPVTFETQNVRLAADTVVDGVCDLTLLMPVPTGGGTPIVVGPPGVSIEDASITGPGHLELELSDGSTLDAGLLPVGPGGSDAGVAGYVGTAGSATEAAVAAKIGALTDVQGDLVFNVSKAPFSATFNNVQDVTAKVQAALDRARDALANAAAFTAGEPSATVVLPIGYGKVTGLTIYNNVRLRGQGDGTVLILTGNSNKNLIQSESWGSATDQDRGIWIDDVRLIGNETNQAANLNPRTYVTADTPVSTTPTTLPVHDTTGLPTSGKVWAGTMVVSYTGTTADSLTGATIYSGSDIARKSVWVTRFDSQGHLVAIQGRRSHVRIYGEGAAGDGVHFQGTDPLRGDIAPENVLRDGTRIGGCRGFGFVAGEGASDGWIGDVELGPANRRGSLLVRAENWKHGAIHLVGTYGNTIPNVGAGIVIAASNFRGGVAYFDTFPGTAVVFDGTVRGVTRIDDIDIAQHRFYQCSWGAAGAGHGVLFKGIRNRTTVSRPRFAGINMTSPIANGYVNGPWTRVLYAQNLAALAGGKLQVTSAADFAPASTVGGEITVNSQNLAYTGRQMNFTKLTATASPGDTSIAAADTTGFDASGTITLLAESNGSYTPQVVTYTGKTATSFTGIPTSGGGSITAVTSSAGQRGQIGQHFFTGVTAGTGTAATDSSVRADDQTVTVAAMKVRDNDFQGFRAQPFLMLPADTWDNRGSYSGGVRMRDVTEADTLTVGEEVFDRQIAGSSGITMTSGILRGAYFTANDTEVITQVRMWSGAVAAAATPSLIRVGVWTAGDDGSLIALVGSTANDTTLLAAANTQYTKALSASFRKVRGQRYFVGMLVVTAQTAPQMSGSTFGVQNGMLGQSPVLGLGLTGQSDLPATLSAGSVTPGANRPYFVLLP